MMLVKMLASKLQYEIKFTPPALVTQAVWLDMTFLKSAFVSCK